MVHKNQFYIALFLLFLAVSCRPQKDFPDDFKGEQIHFGQGGGFSGILTYFVLLDDGRLYQKAYRDSTYSLLTKWPDDFVNQMFENYQLLHLDKVDHYEPGDLYYFIEFHNGPKEVHRIAWGKPGFTPADNVVIFYNLLYRSTKSKS